MEGKYKVVIEDYYRKNVGRTVSSHNTLTNARKSAYEVVGDYNNKMVSVYEVGKNIAGPYILKGEVHKWYQGTRYWYPSKDGHYASAGKYQLYKNGTLGKRLR